MKKVVILGGTFNPVHFMHSKILQSGMELVGATEKYYLINNIPPHKQKHSIDNKHRLNMLQLQCNADNAKIIDYELQNDCISYTYNTILYLKDKNPNWDIYFLIGQDNINILSKWHEIEKLSKLVTFVGCKRLNEVCQTSKYCNIFLDIEQSDCSSTNIRLGNYKHCNKDVYNYIKKHNLYK